MRDSAIKLCLQPRDARETNIFWHCVDWRWTARLAPRIDATPSEMDGRIAQVVEQLTLNQRVVGSNPTAPTNKTGPSVLGIAIT